MIPMSLGYLRLRGVFQGSEGPISLQWLKTLPQDSIHSGHVPGPHFRPLRPSVLAQ